MQINKGNTGIDGVSLVVPDIDVCPLCGYRWVMISGNERWENIGHVRVDCNQAINEKCETIAASLHWTCARCGYRHTHG